MATATQKKLSDSEMQALFELAQDAGRAAARGTTPTPMVVQERVSPLNDSSAIRREWVVDDGPCGFAWVTIRPGTSRFARFLTRKGLARSAYGGGVQVSIRDYNQSLMRKSAHASAMARVLRENGIDAWDDSRMD